MYKIVAKEYKNALIEGTHWEAENEVNGEIIIADDFSEILKYAEDFSNEIGEAIVLDQFGLTE